MTSDSDGNTLSDSSGRTYTWDSQNRMASCTYQGQTTTFSYGSDGLRRSMTVGEVTIDYAYDGTMLVRELQTNQQTGLLAPSVTYMVGPMGPCCRINEQNQSEGYYPAGVTSAAALTRGVTRWYVYDGLGSVIGELDDNNNMTTSRQYDVYGAPRAGTQQGVAATSSQGYVGSLGHVTDQSTGGLIYMQARYYDPSLGRFVSEDPGKDGSNWYGYCGDQPTNEADATGKNPVIVMALILAFIIGGYLECKDHPSNDWQHALGRFLLGGIGAVLTAAASIFGGVGWGFAVGAVVGAVEAAVEGKGPGGILLNAVINGVCGYFGGYGGAALAQEGCLEVEAALSAEQSICYLLLGCDESLGANDAGNYISLFD